MLHFYRKAKPLWSYTRPCNKDGSLMSPLSVNAEPGCKDGTAPATLEQAIRQLDCFAGCDASVVMALLPHADLIQYQAGDTIIALGQYDGAALFGLAAGEARLTKATAATGDIDVQDVDPGKLIGLAPVLAGYGLGPQALSLVATTDLSMVLIDASGLMGLAHENMDVAKPLLRHCAAELVRSEAPMDEEIGPERRVYRHVLGLVERRGEAFIVPQMPRHAALGEMAGAPDRVAAAAVAHLISTKIAHREFPGLVIAEMESLRALAY